MVAVPIKQIVLENQFLSRSDSPETRRVYARTLRQFAQFVRRELTTAGPPDIRDWRESETQRGRRASTVTQKLSILRSYYDFLLRHELINSNPVEIWDTPSPRRENSPPGRRLTPRQIDHLLAAPDRRTAQGARDYAILLCLVRLGLSRAEVCRLRVDDVARGHGKLTLRVEDSGGQPRLIPAPADLGRAIADYLRLDGSRRALLHSADVKSPLFQPTVNNRTNEFARGLDGGTVRRLVSRLAIMAGLGKLRPQDLRHTAVAQELEAGASYRQVQKLTGHRDLKSIRRHNQARLSRELPGVERQALTDHKRPRRKLLTEP